MAGRRCPWFGLSLTQTHPPHTPTFPWCEICSAPCLGKSDIPEPSTPHKPLASFALLAHLEGSTEMVWSNPVFKGGHASQSHSPSSEHSLGTAMVMPQRRANVITCNPINECKSQTTVRQWTGKPPTTLRQRTALFPISSERSESLMPFV